MNGANTFPNNRYGPAGVNDNNFGHLRTPSNLQPPNGGMPGNPFGRYNQLTTNTQQNMAQNPMMSKFSEAYAPRPVLIEPINYTNPNNLLHNNVAPTVLDEHIVEYKINIDSLDRDIAVFPDPFCFNVDFNASASELERNERTVNGQYMTTTTKYKGSPAPIISREFRNVKYVKLDSIVLPQYSNVIEVNNTWIRDPDSYLVDDRFVTLQIDQLNNNDRVYSTYDSNCRLDENGNVILPPQPFGIIYPDTKLGNIYYTGTPYNANRIYNNSALGNISRLDIKFFDGCGMPLKFDNLYTAKELAAAEIANNPIPVTDIRHPLNKKHQLHMTLIIGVAESQINTNTKYEK